jgi:hypothetical protein
MPGGATAPGGLLVISLLALVAALASLGIYAARQTGRLH